MGVQHFMKNSVIGHTVPIGFAQALACYFSCVPIYLRVLDLRLAVVADVRHRRQKETECNTTDNTSSDSFGTSSIKIEDAGLLAEHREV